MSSTRRQKRQNHPAAPSSNRNQSPPQMPFGCLRSADSIYELFERKTKIGRGQKCEVILTTSKSISSAHATIIFDGNETILRDLNSTNGTFVNNVRVHNDTYPLETGDIIRFGCDVQSYRFEHSQDMIEYKPRAGSQAGSPSRVDEEHYQDNTPNRGRRSGGGGSDGRRPQTAAAGYSNHRVRRSDSPENRDRGQRGNKRQPQQQSNRRQQERPRTSGGIRRSRGENPEDDIEPPAGSQSPLPPPNVHRSHRLPQKQSGATGSNSVDQLSIQLARAEGEKQGRLEAELEELRMRLAESDGKSAGIRQYRQEARKLIRRSRHRAATGENGDGNEDNNDLEGVDPDANVVVYKTAHGTKRERSPTRQRQKRSPTPSRDNEDAGDPFEYADGRPIRRDENGNDVRVNKNEDENADQEENERREEDMGRGGGEGEEEEEEEEDTYGGENGNGLLPGGSSSRRGGGERSRKQRKEKRNNGNDENVDNYHDSMDEEDYDKHVDGDNGNSRTGMRRARSSPLHNRSKALRQRDQRDQRERGTEDNEHLQRQRTSSPKARSERGSTGTLLEGEEQRFVQEQKSNIKRRQSKGDEVAAKQQQQIEDEEDDFMAMGGGGDESMPDEFMSEVTNVVNGGGDQSSPPDESTASLSRSRSSRRASPSMSPSTADIEGEQSRMIKALQERLAIAEETQRNTLSQLNQMAAKQKERDQREARQAQEEVNRRITQEEDASVMTGQQQQQQQQQQQPLSSELRRAPQNVQEEKNKENEMNQLTTKEEDEAIDRSLVHIKERLDDSMGRREILRKAIETLTEKAVQAHVAKMESAENMHREEMKTMKESSSSTSLSKDNMQSKDATGEEAVMKTGEARVETGVETGETGNAGNAGVPSLTPSQLLLINEASERELKYMNQLDTAREAIQSMRLQLTTAEEKQTEETKEMKRIAKEVEAMHSTEVNKMVELHRAAVASMQTSNASSMPLQNVQTMENEQQEQKKHLEKSPSQAQVVFQSLVTDMDDHEETSKLQLDRLRNKLEETETIHVRQLNEMRARHRRELELAAVGGVATTLIPQLTEIAIASASNSPRKVIEGDVEGGMNVGSGGGTLEEAMVTTRRAAQNLRHEATEYAHPSPSRRRKRKSTNDKDDENIENNMEIDIVRDMKELADVARREHVTEIERLKTLHREQVNGIRNKTNSQSSATNKTDYSNDNNNNSNEEVDALRSEVKTLRSLLEAASIEAPMSPSSSTGGIETSVARAAVLRPLVKGLHLTGLERGFRALVSEREEHVEKQKATARRNKGGLALHCVAQRGARGLLQQGWERWTTSTSVLRNLEREAIAIRDAVAESGDAVRAQGLELYCVELQQRLSDMKEERTEQESELKKLERMDWPRVIMRQKRTIGTLQESIVQSRKDTETERSSFARAMQKAMTALDNATSKKRNRRGGGGSSESNVTDNVHNLQEFITDISRQVSQHREEALEWQRRHRQSTKAWVSRVFSRFFFEDDLIGFNYYYYYYY